MPTCRSFRRGLRASAALIVVLAASVGPPASGQTPDPAVDAVRQEIAALRSEYEQRIAALEQKLADLTALQEMQAEAQPAPLPPPPPTTATTAATQTANYFNPAISLVGNFLAAAGDNRGGELQNASLRESELGLQAVVDPYARADLYLSFGEEGVEVEEGYVTLTSLPAQFLARVGRMRAHFGKVNTLHLHTLPWADDPLPVVNLLGDEGWIGTGVSVARLIPLGNTFSELTLDVLRADSPGLFAADSLGDLAWNAHYRVFSDLTDSSNLDLGLSYAVGPNGVEPNTDTQLQGLDVTYRWKPLQQGLYRGLILRGELYQSQRETDRLREDAVGWYLSGEYQLAKRWWLGGRYEASERAAAPALRDTGEALLLTFSPSEFLQLRGELRRRDLAEGLTSDDFLLQLQFAIGAHGAHPF